MTDEEWEEAGAEFMRTYYPDCKPIRQRAHFEKDNVTLSVEAHIRAAKRKATGKTPAAWNPLKGPRR